MSIIIVLKKLRVKKNLSAKVISLILAIVGLAFIVSLINLAIFRKPVVAPTKPAPVQPTPAETLLAFEWKTFVDEEFGYSIKYPSNWYLHQYARGTETYGKEHSAIISTVPGSTSRQVRAPDEIARLIVSRRKLKKEETLESWMAPSPLIKHPSLEKISLGGASGLKAELPSEETGSESDFVFVGLEKNGYVYMLEGGVVKESPSYSEYRDVFFKMLEAFKFTR